VSICNITKQTTACPQPYYILSITPTCVGRFKLARKQGQHCMLPCSSVAERPSCTCWV